MTAPRARELARAEVTRQITDAARRQLAGTGAQALSLRAVARELGMVSSAVYRYFRSRDELLTALIIDAFDAIGAAAEEAAATGAGADPGLRWLAVCRAVRRWALGHPHEFALVYGSPVVGYQAPAGTVTPATRTARVLATLLAEAVAAGTLTPPERPIPEPRLVLPEVARLGGAAPPPPYADVPERSLVLLTTLVGTINFELFGHLHNVVTDYDRYFETVMALTAELAGWRIPLPEPTGQGAPAGQDSATGQGAPAGQDSATRSASAGLQ